MPCVITLHGIHPKIRLDITFYSHRSSTWQSKSGTNLAGLEVEKTFVELLGW